jgi:hypothetical protein
MVTGFFVSMLHPELRFAVISLGIWEQGGLNNLRSMHNEKLFLKAAAADYTCAVRDYNFNIYYCAQCTRRSYFKDDGPQYDRCGQNAD